MYHVFFLILMLGSGQWFSVDFQWLYDWWWHLHCDRTQNRSLSTAALGVRGTLDGRGHGFQLSNIYWRSFSTHCTCAPLVKKWHCEFGRITLHVVGHNLEKTRRSIEWGGSYCSNFSPCRVIDVADVMPFPDTVKKRACCVCMVPPVVVGQGKRTEEKVCLSSWGGVTGDRRLQCTSFTHMTRFFLLNVQYIHRSIYCTVVYTILYKWILHNLH